MILSKCHFKRYHLSGQIGNSGKPIKKRNGGGHRKGAGYTKANSKYDD
jgi:hypothetical protein